MAENLSAAQPPLPASAAAQIADAAHSAAPDVPVLPIFHGCVSQWLAAKTYFASAIMVIVALAALIYGSPPRPHHRSARR